MGTRKTFGQSRIDRCPFCNKQCTTINKQGISVCREHKNAVLNEMRCICGEYLEIRKGKYGYFFYCMNCGNQSPKKVFSINTVKDVSRRPKKTEKKEITIKSDDPLYI